MALDHIVQPTPPLAEEQSHTDRDALLRAVRQVPGDRAPRLIYADWLDERGEEWRARRVRYSANRSPAPPGLENRPITLRVIGNYQHEKRARRLGELVPLMPPKAAVKVAELCDDPMEGLRVQYRFKPAKRDRANLRNLWAGTGGRPGFLEPVPPVSELPKLKARRFKGDELPLPDWYLAQLAEDGETP